MQEDEQPQLDRDLSRLTSYHKIDESAKRRYSRPHEKAPLLVARYGGLTLFASQYPKPAE
jgi:hypothetical protein